MSMPTLLDLVKRNGADAIAGLIDDSTKVHPEMTAIPARPIKGFNYRTLVRTALGSTTAGFRSANAGVAPVANSYESRLVEAFLLEATWQADKGLADASEDGANIYVAEEAGGVMEGQFQGISAQVYYGTGTGGNSAGFPGFLQAYDATNMVVDAGGTSAATGSSVWLARIGPKAVQLVLGYNGIFELTPTLADALARPVKVNDPNDSTKQFLAYQQSLIGRIGLQVGSTRALCRIKKLTADAGKGLTDSLITDALAKFPVGMGPNLIFMTQRSLTQLQKSRTATTPTGAQAAFPTEIMGLDGQPIPIKVTEAILNTEALTL